MTAVSFHVSCEDLMAPPPPPQVPLASGSQLLGSSCVTVPPSLSPLPGPPPLPALPTLEGLWAQSWWPFSTLLTP